MKTNLLLAANVLDRKRLAQIADWAAVGVAVSLPWSTSATSILLVVWLLTLVPTLDVSMVRREVETAAGGLPVLLWLLGAVGMLWAEVSWTERIHGLGGFHRLLMIPLLLAQFRRSEHGVWILNGFLASAVILLLVSWVFVLIPGLSWHSHHPTYGVLGQGLHRAKHGFPHLCDRSHVACMRCVARAKLADGPVARGASCALSRLLGVCGDKPYCCRYRSASRRAARLATVRVEGSNDRMHCRSCRRGRIVGEFTAPARIPYRI